MAKIDVTQIEGYDTMTAEQKIAALEGFDISLDTSGYVKKGLYDNVATEVSNLKKKIKEAQSGATTSDEKVKELEKRLKIMDLEKQYVATGYTPEDASKAASAFYDGDTETMFSLQKQYTENARKNAAAEAMKNTPAPDSKANNSQISNFDKEYADALARGDTALASSLISRHFDEQHQNT